MIILATLSKVTDPIYFEVDNRAFRSPSGDSSIAGHMDFSGGGYGGCKFGHLYVISEQPFFVY